MDRRWEEITYYSISVIMRDLSTETTGMSVINLMKEVVIRSGNRSDEGGGRLSRRRGYADRRPEGINDVESELGRSEEMVENHRRDLEAEEKRSDEGGGGGADSSFVEVEEVQVSDEPTRELQRDYSVVAGGGGIVLRSLEAEITSRVGSVTGGVFVTYCIARVP
ncbi:hypothetical protein L2E82_47113 [Cichorium intybus]|uniref:Uncharacterized protein n=1 Tax=Cichorium intybus TaxID=13427 RepID=A0ACB8YVM7_CICIN|nr:hypothetical protein L2E82_47113 [Cichorium intybus]